MFSWRVGKREKDICMRLIQGMTNMFANDKTNLLLNT